MDPTTDPVTPEKRPFRFKKAMLLAGLVAVIIGIDVWVMSGLKHPLVPDPVDPIKPGQVIELAGRRGVQIANLESLTTEDGVFRNRDSCAINAGSAVEIISAEDGRALLRYHRSRDRAKNYTVSFDPHGIHPKGDGECPDKAVFLSDAQEINELRREARINGGSDDDRAKLIRKLMAGAK